MDWIKFQELLAKKWNYKKLPKKLSLKLRKIYKDNIPKNFDIEGDNSPLFSLEGTKICNRYNRIVVGDYGAFIEIEKIECLKENFKCRPGQEYRYKDPNYQDKVKYYWLTTKDNSDVKIYSQMRSVDYADYKPFKVYVSPYEVMGGVDNG